MLSSVEHSGLIAFMLGLIVVVFAGIGLSMVVDRRLGVSSSVVALETEIRNNESELERLKEVHRRSAMSLDELGPKRKLAGVALATFRKNAAELEQRTKDLKSGIEDLRNEIPALEEKFSRYRARYRKSVRDAAAGEFLADLTTLGGREYHEVYITRVTDAGMEVRHASGTARLPAEDLSPALRERFQWDDEGTSIPPDAGSALRQSVPSAPASVVPIENPRAETPKPDAKKIQSLRAKVIAWESKVSHIRIERDTALSSSYSSEASPRGSLETWQARAGRLGGELAKAEAELAAAKAALALVAPNDSLLRPRQGR